VPTLIDLVLGTLIVLGALLLCAGGLGLARGSDAFARIKSATKTGSVGAVLVLAGIAIAGGNFAVFMRAMAAGVLILIASALTSQILAEAADKEQAEGGTTHTTDGNS